MENGNDDFELVYNMKEGRFRTTSIVHQDYMMVIGGQLESSISDTGEFINHQLGNNTAPRPNIQLPKYMTSPFIKINETTAFSVGGYIQEDGFSSETYFLNIDTNEWKNGPPLKIGRYEHTLGVLRDHGTNKQIVAVVGGKPNNYNIYLDTVELLLDGANFWTEGTFIQYV